MSVPDAGSRLGGTSPRNPPAPPVLSVDALRRRGGEKWLRYPADVLPAFVADMDFAAPEPVQQALAAIVSRQDYGYPLPSDAPAVPAAFARHMLDRFGWQVEPAWARVTTDVVQAITACLLAFSEPGDGVVVQTPAYPPFLQVIAQTGRRLVENRLADDGTRYVLDADTLRRSVDDRTRILLVCSPHNPTGRVFTEAELAVIGELAVERGLVIVSDEIHADLVFPGCCHIPLGSLGGGVAARTVTLTSATKAFSLAGLRCAVAHFGSAELCDRFDRAIPAPLLGSATTMAGSAAIAAWRDGAEWLAQVMEILRANRASVAAWLASELPAARCYLPEATYLAWIDCGPLGLPTPHPVDFFLTRAGVAMKGGTDFGEVGRDFVRLNFATSPDLLHMITKRISDAVAAT